VTVRGVVFDVGNVIVRWDPRTLYSKIFPDPAERDWFLGNVCTMAWHTRHDDGVPFAENRIPLIARFPEYAAAIIETVAAIEGLHRRGVTLLGLTNMPSSRSAGTFAMSPVFGLLSHIVISGDVGLSKPDRRIFELTARHAGLAPAELLFVDDSKGHTDAAAACGFDIHHFVDPAALHPALVARGLL